MTERESVFSAEFFFFSLSCLCVFSLTVILSFCPSTPYASIIPILEVALACTERGRTLINYFGGSFQWILTPLWWILRCVSWVMNDGSGNEKSGATDEGDGTRRSLRRQLNRCLCCNQTGHYARDCSFRNSIGEIDAVTAGLICLCLYLHYIGYNS